MNAKQGEGSKNDYICAEWADGPRARDISFSRATKERGRTRFEGLGPSARSAHTQFYDIGAFSSQKLVKTSVLFEFPAFSRILEKKIMTGIFFSKIIFGKPGKRPRV